MAEFNADDAQLLLKRLYSDQQKHSDIEVAVTVALASLYLCRDQADKAQAILLPFAEKNVVEPAVYMNLGHAAKQQKMHAQADRYYRKVLEICGADTFYHKKATGLLKKQVKQ